MSKYKNFNVNYDVILARFFDSVIGPLSEYYSRCDNMLEQTAITDTLARLKLIAKNPQKYLTENKKSIGNEDFIGLTYMRNENGYNDMLRYPLVNNVISRLITYYTIPTSKCHKDALDGALKDYFLTYEPSILRHIQYTLMSPGRMLAYLSKQKTK